MVFFLFLDPFCPHFAIFLDHAKKNADVEWLILGFFVYYYHVLHAKSGESSYCH